MSFHHVRIYFSLPHCLILQTSKFSNVSSSNFPHLATYDWTGLTARNAVRSLPGPAPDIPYVNSYLEHVDYKLGRIEWTPRSHSFITPEEWSLRKKTPRSKHKELRITAPLEEVPKLFDFRVFILQNLQSSLRSLSQERESCSSLRMTGDLHAVFKNTKWRFKSRQIVNCTHWLSSSFPYRRDLRQNVLKWFVYLHFF